MTNKKIAEAVLDLVESGRFEKWYKEGGNFDKYVTGDMEHETKLTFKECREEIVKDLVKMLEPHLRIISQ